MSAPSIGRESPVADAMKLSYTHADHALRIHEYRNSTRFRGDYAT
jgi:hypothetical protein